LHNNVVNDALNIDVRIFCIDVMRAVESWLPSASMQPHFAANMAWFAQRYPSGLSPYVTGLPVIG
jgi:hypothetical protein